MASLLGILLEFLCRLRPAKDRIKRFLRRWTSLLAFLVRKISKWRFLCSSKLGTIRNPKPAESSFYSDRAGSSSVSGDSIRTGRISGYVAVASTVPASANQPLGRECADPQSDPTPLIPTLATPSPVHPHGALDPSPANKTVGSGNADHSSGSPGIEIDRPSVIHRPLPAPVQDDRPSRDQVGPGPGPGASREGGRSSRPPSPEPFLITAQPPNLISTNPQENTEEPMPMDTSKQSSLDNVLFRLEGSSIQPINSEQIPRYTKHDTM